jgi:hypothetical protein
MLHPENPPIDSCNASGSSDLRYAMRSHILFLIIYKAAEFCRQSPTRINLTTAEISTIDTERSVAHRSCRARHGGRYSQLMSCTSLERTVLQQYSELLGCLTDRIREQES